jgi:hypothetical protein
MSVVAAAVYCARCSLPALIFAALSSISLL